MNCIDFMVKYADWLEDGRVRPLSKSALRHQAGCARCTKYAREMLDPDVLEAFAGNAPPVPKLDRMLDRIIAAHQPTEIHVPRWTSFRPAVLMAVSAVCVWAISFVVPALASMILQLLLVFGASSMLLIKIFKYGKQT
jgi:hypothetical protein